MGLKPEEFWNMTLKEIEVACNGYEVREARKKELPRYIATILLNVYSKGGRRINPEDVMRLITDGLHSHAEVMSRDEYEEMNKYFDNIKWQKS